MKAILFLQNVQEAHDEIAHREVSLLDKDKRLNHYVLHFFKYASNISDLEDKYSLLDVEDITSLLAIKKQVRDTFLLNLAIANTYNKELVFTEINNENKNEGDLRVLLRELYTKNINCNEHNVYSKIYKSLLKNGSRMAKTIEAIDHMEPINVEREILEYNERIFNSVVNVMAFLQENANIYWEKEILLTHAEIKFKKPWVKNKLILDNSSGQCSNKDIFLPTIDYSKNFTSAKSIIIGFLNKKINNLNLME